MDDQHYDSIAQPRAVGSIGRSGYTLRRGLLDNRQRIGHREAAQRIGNAIKIATGNPRQCPIQTRILQADANGSVCQPVVVSRHVDITHAADAADTAVGHAETLDQPIGARLKGAVVVQVRIFFDQDLFARRESGNAEHNFPGVIIGHGGRADCQCLTKQTWHEAERQQQCKADFFLIEAERFHRHLSSSGRQRSSRACAKKQILSMLEVQANRTFHAEPRHHQVKYFHTRTGTGGVFR